MNEKMPVLFVGHGSPMNAIENNEFTRGWEAIAAKIPTPKAILSISAHWYTEGTKVNDSDKPETIYDMYGFPDELYKVVYDAPGAPELAHLTKNLITRAVTVDNTWGLDHGTWSVLHRMYPTAEIPVFQLSIDLSAAAATHYQIGQELQSLRDQGVLIFGSGNIVHNLSRVNWELSGGYSWADEFDAYIKECILNHRYQDVINYHSAGESSKLAFFTPDHFYPLLYVLGAAGDDDNITIFNDSRTLGSMSMTSYLISDKNSI
ncbi:4,5-DOPA dioxygenase extradiol [Acetobacterium paludosum]|uniref:4,5-DOPA dioxygenase extradiol n=1 Tax=Acetobacterium paludosum TaxID=52693 RepID=A0A923KNU5_9FIRM|nr:4,5-DOPA dioxygenase extradiol [Acetobacterium paludosum]MBC3887464.1 4,5-DOPA dioxygenase extradiol [Acetobacterium paludosum]